MLFMGYQSRVNRGKGKEPCLKELGAALAPKVRQKGKALGQTHVQDVLSQGQTVDTKKEATESTQDEALRT